MGSNGSVGVKGTKPHDEESVNFYTEQFCSKADVVYRLAFALTLNLDTAREITEAVFQKISDDIEKISANTTNPRVVLLKACWEQFKKHGNGGPSGASELIAALRVLSVDARAAIVAVDYAGIRPDELEDVFGWDTKKGRTLLAEARRQLVSTDIKV